MTKPKKEQGFAVMDPERQREIASLGGTAAHKKGKAHQWTTEAAREAGRKGGLVTNRRRQERAKLARILKTAEEKAATPPDDK